MSDLAGLSPEAWRRAIAETVGPCGLPGYPTPDPLALLQPAPPAAGIEAVPTDRELQVEVVVVGGGPGGGSAALALVQAGLKVLLLEEGPARSYFRKNYAHTARYHMQEAGTMVARGSAMMPIAAGRGLGGSSLVNSALSFRPPRHVLDHWAALLDDPSLGFDALQPLYDEVSGIVGVGLTRPEISGENNDLIVRGIEKLGLLGGLAPRGTPGCVGCGVCYFGCPSGGKGSTNLTFLPRAAALGLQIQAEVKVETLIVEGGVVRGVKAVTVDPHTGARGATLTVRADHVVLAAGAVGTPRLLWHAGVAPTLGPHTGAHLQVHPGSTIIAICDHDVHMWKGATQGAYFHHPELPGVLPHTFSAPPEACLVAAGFLGDRWQEGLELLPRMCGMLLMVSDKGEGSVRAFADGRADLTYTFADEDVERIKRGLVEVARVLQAGGAKDLYVPIHGVPKCADPDTLARHLTDRTIRDFTLYAAHPMGTCRMGTSKADGVVNRHGRAFGLENLWIGDASVFPSSLGVNPQLSTMVMGTRVGRAVAAQG